ncbi:hypothetical protein N7488_011500 [Penicillium malachiteum]|nr:hypothetical protein N7488_011500 [Penicillium malachiteum]
MGSVDEAYPPKRPVRIGGASGGFTNRQRSILSFARDNDVDVIIGDWMSEMTMQWHGAAKAESAQAGHSIRAFDPSFMAAQCYLGGAGIAEAFRAGADIVICGRVSDAAPVIGAAMWWHGWDRNRDYDALAESLIAGHLTECSSYVCGGYYSGFKELFEGCENIGFPIAAINKDGTFILEKEPNTGGEISIGTATSQLLYDIQGPRYYGSDVVAVLEGIHMQQIAKGQVLVTGVKGSPPPTTTKAGITAREGYQAELHYYMCGLDLKEKAEWTERQIRHSMGKSVEKFSCLKFSLNGWCQEDPENQDVATVDFRIFVQTKDKNLLGAGSMLGFQRWCMENFLQSVPGASIENDLRQTSGKEYFEYWAALLPQSEVHHQMNLPWLNKIISIPSSTHLEDYGKTYDTRQWTYDTRDPIDLASYGPTERRPLGSIVLGRSGDKASDANVGFFVRNYDEWHWLRSLLTVAKMKELLGPEYNVKDVDRFEIPALRAVHFLLHDDLDRGWSATSTYDGLGKNVCEYLRAKFVDIPVVFLERGTVSNQRRFQD